ncbi:monooxygenase [Jidongwangia harbinensis]|uniref:monooxygenase n=1 Tax=Jidongwangia harbinensis TaxID=2878561 RepID=UPI001CD9A536|nr:monooxygenase [Jidongwangia harbinensis]MCA2213077.1 monooxygenase [Jidongwangia harbinensis]
MAVNARPSGPAWKFGAATMALATAFTAVAACGSDADKSPAPAAPGSHSAHAGAAPAPQQPLRAGERFVDLKVPEAYAPAPPEGGGSDEYRCQIIDPGLTKTQFLTGTLFTPSNVAIAHHANVYAVPAKGAAAAREHDAKTPGVGWQCFGGTGVPGYEWEQETATWVNSWFPGGPEDLFDQDVGHKVGPGSLLILQTHYNLLALDGKPAEPDRSAVRLRLKDGTPKTRALETWTLDAPTELPCTADESGPLCDRAASIADVTKRFGEDVGTMADRQVEECTPGGKPKPGNTQTCDEEVEEPATLYGGYSHMHYLGRSIKLELNPGTPKARVLLDVPKFDFDAQRLIKLPSPVDIGPGDTLRATCTHDAGLRKQLPQLKKLPPRYVVWGDGTSDEMCTNIIFVSPRKS